MSQERIDIGGKPFAVIGHAGSEKEAAKLAKDQQAKWTRLNGKFLVIVPIDPLTCRPMASGANG